MTDVERLEKQLRHSQETVQQLCEILKPFILTGERNSMSGWDDDKDLIITRIECIRANRAFSLLNLMEDMKPKWWIDRHK